MINNFPVGDVTMSTHEQDRLVRLLQLLDKEQLKALTKIVESMVYPIEEATEEDIKAIKKAKAEYKSGDVIRGEDAERLFD